MDTVCPATDDNGKVCGRKMSKREVKQDGMCGRCADLIWTNFVQPMWNGRSDKPIIFKD